MIPPQQSKLMQTTIIVVGIIAMKLSEAVAERAVNIMLNSFLFLTPLSYQKQSGCSTNYDATLCCEGLFPLDVVIANQSADWCGNLLLFPSAAGFAADLFGRRLGDRFLCRRFCSLSFTLIRWCSLCFLLSCLLSGLCTLRQLRSLGFRCLFCRAIPNLHRHLQLVLLLFGL